VSVVESVVKTLEQLGYRRLLNTTIEDRDPGDEDDGEAKRWAARWGSVKASAFAVLPPAVRAAVDEEEHARAKLRYAVLTDASPVEFTLDYKCSIPDAILAGVRADARRLELMVPTSEVEARSIARMKAEAAAKIEELTTGSLLAPE
jgi:hypothetical protein